MSTAIENKLTDSSYTNDKTARTSIVARHKAKLIFAGQLHWFHWVVILLSILLTIGIWHLVKKQAEAVTEERFLSSTQNVVGMVKERMQLYENALWGSVSFINSNKGKIDYLQWLDYASNLKLDVVYPGINGIGVIYNIKPAQKEAYLQREQTLRPDYELHPEHKETEFWPITYIEPVAANLKSVGLDMAFESNRYSAIKKARDTATAQVTGPITLVQDLDRTPGFLFYTPFYQPNLELETVDSRRENIIGVTYAPFIMKSLMNGTLASENRDVSLTIKDAGELLYSDKESNQVEKHFLDPTPQFSHQIDVDMYGRQWTFDVASNLKFREANTNSQPVYILLAGVIVNAFLITFIFLLARSSRQALNYTAEITEELQVKTDYVRNIIDSMNDSLFVIDGHGLIETVNQRLRDLLGYEKGELKGKPANHLFTEPVINDDNSVAFADEFFFRSKSEEIIPVYVSASSLNLQTMVPGETPWVVVVVQDIREQRDVELKLQQALIKSQAAAHAKSQFLATMSHEIRTPMNGVMGMAQLLQDTELNETQKEYIGVINSSGNSLLTIINDILDFSKLDSNMAELENIPFDLEHVAYECLQLLGGKVCEKKLEFIFDFHPDCPNHFLGDPSRLRQVFLNLLGNSVKFTDEGYIRFGVYRDTRKNEAGEIEERLIVEIEDTGIGLKPEAIEHLFDEFTQADQNTTRKYGGTGLGLAITKKLVTLMKGDLVVESEYGSGSTFRIYLPLATTDSPQPLAKNSLLDERILLVEDHIENRRVFERLLTHLGVDALILDDPERVIDCLHQAIVDENPFKVAILDHDMPKISGLDLGLKIRSNESFDELRLLMFATIGQKGDASAYQNAGFNAYLNKLSQRHILQKVLKELLSPNSHEHLITQHSIEEAEASERNEKATLTGHILLVEDILPNQMIARKFLQNMGLSVELADNGEIAVDYWSKGAFDLILMDCRMPVMDGYEATKKIREIEKDKDLSPIPIIALTANASPEDRLLCQQAGMNDIITKPFKRSDLYLVLQQWLSEKDANTA